MLFAEKAEKDGLANVGRLFRAASYAEQVHASRHLRTLLGVGRTADNLAAAIAGETYEFESMYPALRVGGQVGGRARRDQGHPVRDGG